MRNRGIAKKMAREIGREESLKFTKTYFQNLVDSFVAWEVDDSAMERFLEDTEYMSFPILFANDNSIVLDAGVYRMYIEWGISECPVYVDVRGEYKYVGKVRNSRFWALADRFKSK